MMTLTQFQDAVDRHGPRIAEWPEQDRAAGSAFAAGPLGQDTLTRAERLDTLLREIVEPGALSAAQLGRLTAGLEARRARAFDPLLLLNRRRNLIAAMSLAVAVFGFGAWTGSMVATPASQIDLAALDLEAAGVSFEP